MLPSKFTFASLAEWWAGMFEGQNQQAWDALVMRVMWSSQSDICSDCAAPVAFRQGFTGLMVMICAIFYFNMLDRRLPAQGRGREAIFRQ